MIGWGKLSVDAILPWVGGFLLGFLFGLYRVKSLSGELVLFREPLVAKSLYKSEIDLVWIDLQCSLIEVDFRIDPL